MPDSFPPAPNSGNPYQSPASYGVREEKPAKTFGLSQKEHLRRIAIYEKAVLVTFGVHFASVIPVKLLAFTGWTKYALPNLQFLSLISLICGIITVGVLGVRLVGTLAGIGMALATIVPCANVLIVLLMIQKANSVLTENGIHVGIFGARMRDFDRLDNEEEA